MSKSQIVGVVVFTLLLGASSLHAWVAPNSNPPSSNVAAPVNTGNANQIKTGGLSVGALDTAGASSFANNINFRVGEGLRLLNINRSNGWEDGRVLRIEDSNTPTSPDGFFAIFSGSDNKNMFDVNDSRVTFPSSPVGIGASPAASELLRVYRNGTAQPLALFQQVNGNANIALTDQSDGMRFEYNRAENELRIQNATAQGTYDGRIVATFRRDGRVGIGTHNPAYTLDVNGSLGVNSIRVGNEGYISYDSEGLQLRGDGNDTSIWVRDNEVYIGDGDDPIHLRGTIDEIDSVRATEYCDRNGGNCTTASQLRAATTPSPSMQCRTVGYRNGAELRSSDISRPSGIRYMIVPGSANVRCQQLGYDFGMAREQFSRQNGNYGWCGFSNARTAFYDGQRNRWTQTREGCTPRSVESLTCCSI